MLKVLEHYKPDPSKANEARTQADRQPPTTQDPTELAAFYRDRGRAAARIGRVSQQIEDLRKAAEYVRAGAKNINVNLLHAELASGEVRGGNLLNAIKLREAQADTAATPGANIAAQTQLATLNALIGDLPAARVALAKADATLEQVRAGGYRGRTAVFRYLWPARVEQAHGAVASAEGRLIDAEAAFRKTVVAYEADQPLLKERAGTALGDSDQLNDVAREAAMRSHAQSLVRMGRLAEAELVARDVLKRGLERVGRYSTETGASLALLSAVLLQQGRYAEAETFAREALDVLIKINVTPESQFMIVSYDRLGTLYAMQRRWAEADAEFTKMRAGLEKDPLLLEKRGAGRTAWAYAMVKLGNAAPAISMLERMLASNRVRYGDGWYEVAEIRGFLAIARGAAGARDAAVADCMGAAPVLTQENTNVGEAGGVQRQWALTQIIEGCVALFVEQLKDGQSAPGMDALAESFRIAEVARGGRVQRALSSSAARAAIADPQLAALARTEQDAEQRLAALNELLSGALSAPAGQQLPKVIEELRKEIAQLRGERNQAKAQIEKRFPDYANLVSPRPPTVEQTRAKLRDGEALVAFYLGSERSFVWAVSKSGKPAVAAIPLGEPAITAQVANLRKALDANASTIDDIPKFDVAAAYELYSALLKPVESAWGDAKSLLIVQHASLGQLPFALLPTAAATVADKLPLDFEGYRQVAWLARRAAITQMPSVNTLITLRSAAPASADRRAYVGFGDPFFSRTQAKEAIAALSDEGLGTRGVRLRNKPKTSGLDSAQLALLPRLPDTRAEILDVAQVMRADVTQDVFLGERASVQAVKTANLANRKVIHFATHGLVPGELDGLTQPALALTTPDLAPSPGSDGLLKMDDILALKLNADWVVLSACNTASADGSGSAEAVSGLGRAFFFAGARALLVSNWPVDSASARKLMTDIFRRQATDQNLDRAQALRQAMMELVDSGVHVDAKDKPLFSYAHPLFWAPFSLVGDGGGR